VSKPGKASVTGNRRVYRLQAGDVAVPAIGAALGLVAMLVMLSGRANALLVVPVIGILPALFLLMSLANLTSVTVASAAGVQPSGRKSRAIAWEEIDSFAAIKRNGRTSVWEVVLVPVENRRPIPLDGCAGPDWRAMDNADELNKILATIRTRRSDGSAQS
jgi:hypothetical protein